MWDKDSEPVPVKQLIDEGLFDTLHGADQRVKAWCNIGAIIECGRSRKKERTRPLPHILVDQEIYVSRCVAREWISEVIQLQVEAGLIDHSDTPYYEPASCQEPTNSQPGSAEKVSVLRARFERGEDLYHPKDEDQPLLESHVEAGSALSDQIIRHIQKLRERNFSNENISEIVGFSLATVKKYSSESSLSIYEDWLTKSERVYCERIANGRPMKSNGINSFVEDLTKKLNCDKNGIVEAFKGYLLANRRRNLQFEFIPTFVPFGSRAVVTGKRFEGMVFTGDENNLPVYLYQRSIPLWSSRLKKNALEVSKVLRDGQVFIFRTFDGSTKSIDEHGLITLSDKKATANV